MSTIRKLLLTIMILSGVGSTVTAGTFAAYTGTTTNATATFATGSLVLKANKTDGTNAGAWASACFSTGAGTSTDVNANDACGTVIDVEVRKPGDTAFADVTLENPGNLTGTLGVRASQACTTTIRPDWDEPTGDVCAGANLTIQQYASATARTNGDTTGGWCWYGGGAGTTTCSFSSSATLAGFAAAHPHTGVSDLAMASMAAAEARYLRITVELPENSANDLQGVQANFGFTWALAQ